jgi:hypothetical protein
LAKLIRKRIESGEEGECSGDWWQWFADNFHDRSRGDAEKLMKIASAEDPQIALEIANARNAAHQQTWRDRQKQNALAVPAPSYGKREAEPEPEPDPASFPLTRQRETELPSDGPASEGDGTELDYQPATPSPTASLGDRSAMRLYSTLGALQSEYLHQSPADVAARMTDEMRPRLREVAPLVAQWLWAAAQAAGFKPERKQ